MKEFELRVYGLRLMVWMLIGSQGYCCEGLDMEFRVAVLTGPTRVLRPMNFAGLGGNEGSGSLCVPRSATMVSKCGQGNAAARS